MAIAWRFKDERLNIFPLTVRSTATLDTLPTEFPFADLPVTGASADFGTSRRGEMFRVIDGSTVILEGIWRRNAAGDDTEVKGLGISQGDSGRAKERHAPLAAGQTVECYTVRPPYTFFTRLDGETINKRWDLPYSDQGENPSAQANLGTHKQVDAVAGVGTVDFSAAGSFSWVGGTLTYEWILPAGCSFSGGSVATDETVEIEADPGSYVISCSVTDSVSGTTERSYRYLFVNDPTDNPAFNQSYSVVSIDSDNSTQTGREMSFTVMGSGISSLIYTGAPVLYKWTDEDTSDGATWADTTGNVTEFFGYIRAYTTIENDGNGVQTISFTVQSPLLWAMSMRFIPQPIFENDTPTDWQYVIPDLAHAGFYAYYIGDMHTRWLQECHDYYPGDAVNYFRAVFALDRTTIGEAVRQCAEIFWGNAGSISSGGVYMFKNPLLEDIPPATTYRDSVDDGGTIADTDIIPPLRYARDLVMQNSETEAGWFIYAASGGTTAGRGRAGKGAPMQGLGTIRAPALVVASNAEGKAKLGHYHAYQNRATKSVEFTMLGHRDPFEPARMKLFTFNVASYDPMATGVFSNRFLVESVRTAWNLEAGERTITVTAIPETYGLPAREKVLPAWNGSGITPVSTRVVNFDFTTGQHGWEAIVGAGYISGEGFRTAASVEGDGNKQRVDIRSEVTLIGTITRVLVCIERDASDTITGDGMDIRLDATQLILSNAVADSGFFTLEYTGSVSAAGRKLIFSMVYQPITTTSTVKSVCVELTGGYSAWFNNGELVAECSECA